MRTIPDDVEEMTAKKSSKSIIRIIILILIVGIIAFIAYNYYTGSKDDRKANDVVESLRNIIPGLGVDTDVATGLGRDPLASVSIDGIDIVGVIEIPALDIMTPVMHSNQENVECFTRWIDGSPVKGNFKILGGKDDVFRRLAGLKPGDRAIFTDIDGIRYSYEVMTQYHLKKWDEGDNDLQLCYESDDDTYFVVGCTMILGK